VLAWRAAGERPEVDDISTFGRTAVAPDQPVQSRRAAGILGPHPITLRNSPRPELSAQVSAVLFCERERWFHSRCRADLGDRLGRRGRSVLAGQYGHRKSRVVLTWCSRRGGYSATRVVMHLLQGVSLVVVFVVAAGPQRCCRANSSPSCQGTSGTSFSWPSSPSRVCCLSRATRMV
jgi:hypothetical protein